MPTYPLRPLVPALFAAAGFLATLPAHAAAQLIPADSEITFVSRQMGQDVAGGFKRFEAAVDFDPRQPAKGRMTITVDTGSVSMNAPEVIAELLKPEWFDTVRFPKARFDSGAIRALGGGRFEVSGKLAIKGVARDAVVPVQLTQAGGRTTAVGSFVLKRLAYGIGAGEWSDTSLVGDDITVRFKLVFTGMPPL